MAALENVNLWHERDISHSSAERVIFPDSTIALDYMLNKFIEVIEGPEGMSGEYAGELSPHPGFDIFPKTIAYVDG